MSPPSRYFASSKASAGDPSRLGMASSSYASSLSNTHPDSLLSGEEDDDEGENDKATQDDDDDDEEEDFMSDKFLASAQAVDDKVKKTYSEMRKEQLRKNQERGHVKSRAEREREAREEGLRRNLLIVPSSSTRDKVDDGSSTSSAPSFSATTTTSTANNKALEMMIKMGFKPGEALGKKVGASSTRSGSNSATSSKTASPAPPATDVTAEGQDHDDDDDDGFISLRGGGGNSKSRGGIGSLSTTAGIGAKRSLTDTGFSVDDAGSRQDNSRAGSASASKVEKDGRRIDPIEIQMRSGRGGLGVEEAKRRRLASMVTESRERSEETASDYRIRTKDNFEERRAEGKLKLARKTLVELDTRKGVKKNYLWSDPTEEAAKFKETSGLHDDRYTFASGRASRARLQRIGRLGEYEFDEEGAEYGDDQQYTSRVSNATKTAEQIRREEGGGDRTAEDGPGAADGVQEEAYDEEAMAKYEDDKEAFLQKDARTRLKETLDYLREKYNYCLWCGAQYGSKVELAAECPGEEEDDH